MTNSRSEFYWSQEQNLARKGESDLPAVAKIPTDKESITVFHKRHIQLNDQKPRIFTRKAEEFFLEKWGFPHLKLFTIFLCSKTRKNNFFLNLHFHYYNHNGTFFSLKLKLQAFGIPGTRDEGDVPTLIRSLLLMYWQSSCLLIASW